MNKNLNLNPRFFGTTPERIPNLDDVTAYAFVKGNASEKIYGNETEWRFRPNRGISDTWLFMGFLPAMRKEFKQLAKRAKELKQPVIMKLNMKPHFCGTWLINYHLEWQKLNPVVTGTSQSVRKWRLGHAVDTAQWDFNYIFDDLWKIVQAQDKLIQYGLYVEASV